MFVNVLLYAHDLLMYDNYALWDHLNSGKALIKIANQIVLYFEKAKVERFKIMARIFDCLPLVNLQNL